MTATGNNDNTPPAAEATETADSSAEAAAPPQDPASALREEVAQLKDRLLRAVAEGENIRKRAQRDTEEMSKYAVTGFARDMISVAENLARATASIPEDVRGNPAVKTLADGVEMTMKELLSIFERNGIRRIDPIGQKFDHNFHQAVAQIETPDQEAGTIVQVLQAGYQIHDRLLRPAMVGVAKRGEGEKKVDTTA